MNNELVEFNKHHIAKLRELSQLKKAMNEMQEVEKALKAELEEAMDQYDIKTIDNDYIKVTRVAASSSTSIDLKTLEKKENKLYEELLADYPKVTERKASVRFTVK